MVEVAPPSSTGVPKLLAEGVLCGDGRRLTAALEQVEHREDLDLRSGQGVVTAGGDGRFPPGMVLGTVVRAGRSLDDRWQVEVRLACDAELADSLLVVRPQR